MSTSEIGTLKERVKNLSPKEKVELIKFLTDTLSGSAAEVQPIRFGKYQDSGRRMSAIEDFTIAEWHPTESELNGN